MKPQAKFTTGSTMRHVTVMTLTSALGLSFMFLVDFLALFWVSRLKIETFIAAIGFAGTLQFFLVSISIGLTIGAVALVSRTLGAGRPERARRIASMALIVSVATQACIALLAYFFRFHLLGLTGAGGETLEVAARFLAISLPSLPLIAAGMTASAILRATGDAWRSMAVTSVAGAVAIVLDPLFILGLGWGIEGAALVIVISRGTASPTGFVRPPGPLFGASTPHDARKCFGSAATSAAGDDRNSATSKPMPPAPMMATFSPTGAFFDSTSI